MRDCRASIRAPWSRVVLVVLAVTAVASACGNAPSRTFDSPGAGASSGGGPGGGEAGGGGDGGFGTFGDSGPLRRDGGTAPPKGCDSSCTAAGGACQNNVCVITEDPGGVDPGTMGQLAAGGSGDATFAWLYPYDRTVFPRGLPPPTMQLAGVSPDAVYVHITSAGLDYTGFFKPAPGPLRLALPAPSWTAITNAASGPQDPLEVQVTKIAGGHVAGPIVETWPVAQGSLRGTIYYETYGSQLAGGVASVGLMEIAPGAAQPSVLKTGCGNVCHTASADGSTLVASQTLLTSAAYDLTNNVATIQTATDERFTYGGLYPNGSFGMSATHYRTWIPGAVSRLYDTKTGTVIPALGWDGVIQNAGTTAFSPEGTQIAFVHEDVDQGHTIAKMDVFAGTHTFSGLVDLASDPGYLLGWPAFTPDGQWVVFQKATPASTSAPFETDGGSLADLFIVDVSTKTVARLDALDGYSGSGSQSYLPANDPQLSFAPTVLPEAVGGYFWVVFTSHRAYGNTLPSMAPGADGSADELGQLWVAALDQHPTPGRDASHPAFYLDGQELEADNLRGFWVLPPCKAQGGACTTGDECCEGFCRPAGDGGPLECVPPPGGCANEFEKCSASTDCCNPSYECINGRCAQPAAQ
jgi:hypothetical protein